MFSVRERRVFSAADLRRILMRVLCKHADADVTVYIDFKAVEQLEQDLRVFAVVDHLAALAQLMASMATMISYPVRVVGYTGEDSLHKDALTRKLHTEFSIEGSFNYLSSLHAVRPSAKVGQIFYMKIKMTRMARFSNSSDSLIANYPRRATGICVRRQMISAGAQRKC